MGQCLMAGTVTEGKLRKSPKSKKGQGPQSLKIPVFCARTELLGRLGATANVMAGAGFNSPEKVAILAEFGNRVLRHYGLTIFGDRAGANRGNQLPKWIKEAITESNTQGRKVGELCNRHFERLSQFPYGVINTPMELI